MNLLQLSDDSLWPAPAKLNLFLHITGRRQDGYHELQTLFQFLDFGDVLRFSIRHDDKIGRVTLLSGVEPEQDLVVRAARCLQQASGSRKGADIAVQKYIPMGGGLGGGSSDAATVLVALNQLWELHLPTPVLSELGLSLGADVPVFVEAQAAWAEGVGEKLIPVTLEESWFVVLCPGVSVPTAKLFSSPELTRDSQPITIRDYFEGRDTCNVFEPLVRSQYPVVDQAMQWLSQAAGKTARMTGTGSTVFVRVDNETKADDIVKMSQSKWQCFKARGLNESPLKTKCKHQAFEK